MLAKVRRVYEQIDKMPRDQTRVCNPFAAAWAVCGFLPIPTMRRTCPTFLGMERQATLPQKRGGTTTKPGGTSLLTRTRRPF